MAEFYVTLPSNSSMDIYPDNSISHFTTEMRETINLEDNYEVALVEISMPTRWQNVEEDYFIRFTAHAVSDDLDPANPIFSTEYFKEKVDPAFYERPQQLVRALNKTWESMSRMILKLTRDNIDKTAFVYHESEDVITLDSRSEAAIEVSANLAKLLGLDEPGEEWINVPKNRNKPSQITNMNIMISHIYVYSDIVKYVAVGDTVAPLLRIIPMHTYSGRHKLDHYTHIYNKPHYIPVSRRHIESIHIDLMSDQGVHVPFVTGKSIVKLHFRPRKIL